MWQPHIQAVQPHPKNPWIRNGRFAWLLIFFSRHRVPLLGRLYMFSLGCDIRVSLPKTVFLPHPFGIIIHKNSSIGNNVVIGHQVTFGGRDLGGAAPQVEDGVYIGAGAKILGGVRIGRGATVGANAVVTKDVPAAGVVVGANRLLTSKSQYALD